MEWRTRVDNKAMMATLTAMLIATSQMIHAPKDPALRAAAPIVVVFR
jgi:hypothetical protein